MTRRLARSLVLAASALACALAWPDAGAASDDALPLSPELVKRRWHERLAGRHFSAKVRLSLDLGGLREQRELIAWRTDEAVGAERVLVRLRSEAVRQAVRNSGLQNRQRLAIQWEENVPGEEPSVFR